MQEGIDRLALANGVRHGQVRRRVHLLRLLPVLEFLAKLLEFLAVAGIVGRRNLDGQKLERLVQGVASLLCFRRRHERDEMLARNFLRLKFLAARPGELRALEDPVQPVVVVSRDGIELVVVAAGAAQRETEKRPPGRVDRVLERQVPKFIGRRGVAPRQRQITGRHDLFPVLRRRAGLLGRQQVARQLLADELVVRLVGVEGVDDVVAIELASGTG